MSPLTQQEARRLHEDQAKSYAGPLDIETHVIANGQIWRDQLAAAQGEAMRRVVCHGLLAIAAAIGQAGERRR